MFESKGIPYKITAAHVAAEVREYPRAFVMLEDLRGWAVYSACDGTLRSEPRRKWQESLLDFARIVGGVALQRTYRIEFGSVEGGI